MTKFELTVLGTSSALPTSQRYPTAQVLNVLERFFLIDCGEGTQIQLRRHHIKFSRINHIFISHLHGDHYFGLIGLLSTFALLQRKNDLHIFSHSELPELLKYQLDQLNSEISYRIIWHPLNFKKPQIILDDEIVKVTSIPLKHRVPCCGFVFTEKPRELNLRNDVIEKYQIPIKNIHLIKKGEDFITAEGNIICNSELVLPPPKLRSYAFCTDTLFMPELANLIAGVDLLYHEATYDKTLAKRAEETYHSTSEQAATVAINANVTQLLIGHFSARYKDPIVLLEEAKAIFANSNIAVEGNVYPVRTK